MREISNTAASHPRDAEHHIPKHPSGIAGDKGENAEPEDIKPVLHAYRPAADGEHSRAGKFQREY